MRVSGLACCSCTQQARWRVNSSAASDGAASAISAARVPSSTAREAWARSGRRSAVRRTDWSCRQAAIRGVVAREQHLGHLVAAPDGRLGVDGVLEQPVGRATPPSSEPALPMNPGSSRTTASIIASAATSPPLST